MKTAITIALLLLAGAAMGADSTAIYGGISTSHAWRSDGVFVVASVSVSAGSGIKPTNATISVNGDTKSVPISSNHLRSKAGDLYEYSVPKEWLFALGGIKEYTAKATVDYTITSTNEKGSLTLTDKERVVSPVWYAGRDASIVFNDDDCETPSVGALSCLVSVSVAGWDTSKHPLPKIWFGFKDKPSDSKIKPLPFTFRVGEDYLGTLNSDGAYHLYPHITLDGAAHIGKYYSVKFLPPKKPDTPKKTEPAKKPDIPKKTDVGGSGSAGGNAETIICTVGCKDGRVIGFRLDNGFMRLVFRSSVEGRKIVWVGLPGNSWGGGEVWQGFAIDAPANQFHSVFRHDTKLIAYFDRERTDSITFRLKGMDSATTPTNPASERVEETEGMAGIDEGGTASIDTSVPRSIGDIDCKGDLIGAWLKNGESASVTCTVEFDRGDKSWAPAIGLSARFLRSGLGEPKKSGANVYKHDNPDERKRTLSQTFTVTAGSILTGPSTSHSLTITANGSSSWPKAKTLSIPFVVYKDGGKIKYVPDQLFDDGSEKMRLLVSLDPIPSSVIEVIASVGDGDISIVGEVDGKISYGLNKTNRFGVLEVKPKEGSEPFPYEDLGSILLEIADDDKYKYQADDESVPVRGSIPPPCAEVDETSEAEDVDRCVVADNLSISKQTVSGGAEIPSLYEVAFRPSYSVGGEEKFKAHFSFECVGGLTCSDPYEGDYSFGDGRYPRAHLGVFCGGASSESVGDNGDWDTGIDVGDGVSGEIGGGSPSIALGGSCLATSSQPFILRVVTTRNARLAPSINADCSLLPKAC